jgi:hypothetical protein
VRSSIHFSKILSISGPFKWRPGVSISSYVYYGVDSLILELIKYSTSPAVRPSSFDGTNISSIVFLKISYCVLVSVMRVLRNSLIYLVKSLLILGAEKLTPELARTSYAISSLLLNSLIFLHKSISAILFLDGGYLSIRYYKAYFDVLSISSSILIHLFTISEGCNLQYFVINI